jgi:hypothetical protein
MGVLPQRRLARERACAWLRPAGSSRAGHGRPSPLCTCASLAPFGPLGAPAASCDAPSALAPAFDRLWKAAGTAVINGSAAVNGAPSPSTPPPPRPCKTFLSAYASMSRSTNPSTTGGGWGALGQGVLSERIPQASHSNERFLLKWPCGWPRRGGYMCPLANGSELVFRKSRVVLQPHDHCPRAGEHRSHQRCEGRA